MAGLRKVLRDFIPIAKRSNGSRTIVGGEVVEYTRLMAESREQALSRMTEEAEEQGANAIVATRFMTSMGMSGASELLVYGTAVVAESDET